MSKGSLATSWKEVPVFFKAGSETLLGILTRPTVDPIGAGVILLRGGGPGTSSDRNGVFARLSRHLASTGFHSLRLDYHGVGDSTGVIRHFRLDQPFRADVTGAMLSLINEGIERVALVGLCFGARTALAQVDSDPSPHLLVLVSAPIRDVERNADGTAPSVDNRTLWQLVTKGVRLNALSGLLDPRRRRAYAKLIRAKLRSLATFRKPESSGEVGQWVSPQFTHFLEAAVGRQIPVLFMYGTADPDYEDFRRAQTGPLKDLFHRAGDLVDVRTFDGRIHSFAEARLQSAVIDAIVQWLTLEQQGRSERVHGVRLAEEEEAFREKIVDSVERELNEDMGGT